MRPRVAVTRNPVDPEIKAIARVVSAMEDPEVRRGGGGRTVATYREKCVDWILLSGDREVVALGIVGNFGAFFAVLVLSDLVPLTNVQALFYAYSGLVTGNLTLVTVVVSINQLLLSRELQTPGELESQIGNVVEYRGEVEGAAGEIAPVKPLGFLRLLVEMTRERAQRLGGLARSEVTAGSEVIDEVVTTLTDQLDRVDALLQESDTGTFSVLSVMLETNYAPQINRLREVRAEHEADLPDAVHESIDDLVDRVQEIDVARQYFKAVYLQQELSSLSRSLLYAGLPAVAIAIAGLLVLTVSPGEPSATTGLRLLVVVTLTVGLVPLAILSSFILRTATVTRLTAATLPFTTPEQER